MRQLILLCADCYRAFRIFWPTGGSIEFTCVFDWRPKESGENFLSLGFLIPDRPDWDVDSGDFMESVRFLSSFIIIGYLRVLGQGRKVSSVVRLDVSHIVRLDSRDRLAMETRSAQVKKLAGRSLFCIRRCFAGLHQYRSPQTSCPWTGHMR